MSSTSTISLAEEDEIAYINIRQDVENQTLINLLFILWEANSAFSLYDPLYPPAGRSGAYFSYSTLNSKNQSHWSLTFGNDGWSGGIYQVKVTTAAQQIFSLVKKKLLTRIQVSDVVFFAFMDDENEKENNELDSELLLIHNSN